MGLGYFSDYDEILRVVGTGAIRPIVLNDDDVVEYVMPSMTAAEKRAYYGIVEHVEHAPRPVELCDAYWAGYHGFERVADWKRAIGRGE